MGPFATDGIHAALLRGMGKHGGEREPASRRKRRAGPAKAGVDKAEENVDKNLEEGSNTDEAGRDAPAHKLDDLA